jgi:hypothetical protein
MLVSFRFTLDFRKYKLIEFFYLVRKKMPWKNYFNDLTTNKFTNFDNDKEKFINKNLKKDELNNLKKHTVGTIKNLDHYNHIYGFKSIDKIMK